MQNSCPIVTATRDNCRSYQETSAAFAADARFLVVEGAIGAAKKAQDTAATYHQAAWNRLARLIGVE